MAAPPSRLPSRASVAKLMARCLVLTAILLCSAGSGLAERPTIGNLDTDPQPFKFQLQAPGPVDVHVDVHVPGSNASSDKAWDVHGPGSHASSGKACPPITSPKECNAMATKLGLQLGGKNFPFLGEFHKYHFTFGCYAYGDGAFKGHAFWALGGSPEQNRKPTLEPPHYRLCPDQAETGPPEIHATVANLANQGCIEEPDLSQNSADCQYVSRKLTFRPPCTPDKPDEFENCCKPIAVAGMKGCYHRVQASGSQDMDACAYFSTEGTDGNTPGFERMVDPGCKYKND